MEGIIYRRITFQAPFAGYVSTYFTNFKMLPSYMDGVMQEVDTEERFTKYGG